MKKRFIGVSVGLVVIAVVATLFYIVMKEKPSHVSIPSDREGFSQYYNGDYNTAFNKLLHAAQNGDVDAQVSLGNLYLSGLGVQQNPKAAFYWYNQAAKQNNSDAIVNMAIMYESGLYVSEDISKAVKLYQKAIKIDNNSAAIFNLGLHYLNQKGDFKKQGFELIEKAVKEENPSALSFLGACLYTGKYGLTVDYNRAFELFKKAAQKGNAIAQNNLAVFYYQGRSAPKSDFDAYKWFYISANYGKYQKAKQLLEEYTFDLTDDQRSKAINAAKQWATTHREINSDIVNAN